MDPAFQMLLKEAAGQGFLVLCLILALWIVGRLMLTAMEGRIGDMREHIAEMRDRIVVLERKVDECEKDRRELWQQYVGWIERR